MKKQSDYIRQKISKTNKDTVHLKLRLSDTDMQRAIEFLELESGEGTELINPSDSLSLKHVSLILSLAKEQIQDLIKLGSLTLSEDGESITGSSLIDLYKRTIEFESEDDEDF